MEEVRGLFREFDEDPVGQAVEHAHWWLVNRIRSRADAEEVLKVARACLTPVLRLQSPVRGVAMRQALDLIGDAVEAWDDAQPAQAERLNAWESLDSALAAVTPKVGSAPARHAAEIGRMFVHALKDAYAIQKVGNRASVSWAKRMAGEPDRPRKRADQC